MTQRRRTHFGVPAALVLTIALALAATLNARQEFSSANHERGRAAVEYQDKDLHMVAAYYHSQRHHDSRWIVIDTALSTNDRSTLPRDAFALRTPGGRAIPLATQTRIGENTVEVENLLRHAGVQGHDILSYFPQRDRTYAMRFFTFPFGGVVHDDFTVDRHEVAAGPLFFESPTGAWEEGTYALVVRHPDGVAELPIRLE
jgi:hypothetical protein